MHVQRRRINAKRDKTVAAATVAITGVMKMGMAVVMERLVESIVAMGYVMMPETIAVR